MSTVRPAKEEIIDLLKLEPLTGEGGMVRSTWRSKVKTNGKDTGGAIYYFLSGRAFSHLHRLPTDEIYHFYLGDQVEMLLLYPDGRHERVLLGSDLKNGQHVQFVAPAGCWQGSRLLPGGEYALMGTTMSPAYTEGDYEHADTQALLRQYPDCAPFIKGLTGALVYTD